MGQSGNWVVVGPLGDLPVPAGLIDYWGGRKGHERNHVTQSRQLERLLQRLAGFPELPLPPRRWVSHFEGIADDQMTVAVL